MPKTKISEFSATPGNNTDIDGINIAEGCAPSGINDAIRELMSQLKDFQAGTAGDSFNGPVGTTTAAAGAFTTLSASGAVTLSGGTANGVAYLNGSKVLTTGSALTFDGTNLGFGGTGQRITGDFSNATIANRLMFQTSTANGATSVGAIPVGTGNYGGFTGHNAADPSNASLATIAAAASEVQIVSTRTGTGAFLPMTFYTNSSERMRVTTAGDVGIGTSSPGAKVHALTPSATAVGFRAGNSVSFAEFQVDASGNSQLIAPGGTQIFNTNGSERMRLDSSGNLGLGQTPTAYGATVRNLEAYIAGASGYTLVSASTASVKTEIASSESSLLGQVGTRSNHPLVLKTNDSERMRIDASGNVGIGTSSPQSALDVQSNTNYIARFTGSSNSYLGATIVNSNSGSAARAYLQLGNNASQFGAFITLNSSANTTELGGANALGIYNGLSAPIAFATAGTERARIDSSGNLLVGTTSGPGARLYVVGDSTATYVQSIYDSRTDNNPGGGMIGFQRRVGTGSPSFVGGITTSTTSTAYNTSSDYRLKHDIQPMTGALAKVTALKPVTYKWKADGSDGEGFIAHELAEVVPQCVTGEKDAVDADGNPVYQGIDTSFLVATLTAAIQELKAELDSVKSELASLKG